MKHEKCKEWYCSPDKVSDIELRNLLIKEGPHCAKCGFDFPCPYIRGNNKLKIRRRRKK